jgi:2,3-bisphosphoglycerate-dependent phosphoglycerate mutase
MKPSSDIALLTTTLPFPVLLTVTSKSAGRVVRDSNPQYGSASAALLPRSRTFLHTRSVEPCQTTCARARPDVGGFGSDAKESLTDSLDNLDLDDTFRPASLDEAVTVKVVAVDLIFETHALSEDNELERATGWLDGKLSDRGRGLARELGDRRRSDGIAIVYASDLGRAVETAEIAFADTDMPIIREKRLRECNYGLLNGVPRAQLDADGPDSLDERFPEGESWREAVQRVDAFLHELTRERDGDRVLMIGHMATWYALEGAANGKRLDDLFYAPFEWQEGWEYSLAVP